MEIKYSTPSAFERFFLLSAFRVDNKLCKVTQISLHSGLSEAMFVTWCHTGNSPARLATTKHAWRAKPIGHRAKRRKPVWRQKCARSAKHVCCLLPLFPFCPTILKPHLQHEKYSFISHTPALHLCWQIVCYYITLNLVFTSTTAYACKLFTKTYDFNYKLQYYV